MKLSIQTEILKNITRLISRVSTRGIGESTHPGIHIEVSPDTTRFRTQQFDFNVAYTVKTDGNTPGSVSVPVHILDGVVETLIDTVTTVALDEKKLTVQTPSSTSDILIPDAPDDEGEETEITRPDSSPFTMKREILVQGFRNVHHAAAESAIKPEIASVYMYTKGNSVYFVSTDSFRLAEARFSLESAPKNDISLLIPEKSVSRLLRVLEGVPDTDISVHNDESTIYFSTENFVAQMNGIRGTFPDYKSIIPTDFDLTITVLRSDVQNFLKKAKIFANKLNKLSLKINNDSSVLLEFGNETVGLTNNTVPAVIKGSVTAIPSFNYRFVNDILSVIPDDRVVFHVLEETTKPLMIRGVDSSHLTTIISPLLDK